MNLIDKEILKEYSERGYVIFKNILTTEELKYLRGVFTSLYDNSKRVDADIKVRCYDDFPYFICGGVNVATIEDFVGKLPERASSLLFKMKIIENSIKLLKGKPVSLKLYRAHVTGKFSYEGPWHRDQHFSEEDSDILCNIYLYAESGMRFFNKSCDLHKADSIYFGEDIQDSNFSILSAKAGDVVFLDPKIIHKPYSASKRLHLHFRFTSNYNKYLDFANYKSDQKFYSRDKSFFAGLKRTYRLLRRVINGNSKTNY